MTGDPLAAVEAWALREEVCSGLSSDAVLALVAVARAARQVNDTLHRQVRVSARDEARLTEWGVQLNVLRAALARLDGGPE